MALGETAPRNEDTCRTVDAGGLLAWGVADMPVPPPYSLKNGVRVAGALQPQQRICAPIPEHIELRERAHARGVVGIERERRLKMPLCVGEAAP